MRRAAIRLVLVLTVACANDEPPVPSTSDEESTAPTESETEDPPTDTEDTEPADTEPTDTEPPKSESDCDNGLDDDGDGLVDCEDGDCTGQPACFESDCTDGLDGDGDGDVDCLDADCWGEADCHVVISRVVDGAGAVARRRTFSEKLFYFTFVSAEERRWSQRTSFSFTEVIGSATVVGPSTSATCTFSIPKVWGGSFAFTSSYPYSSYHFSSAFLVPREVQTSGACGLSGTSWLPAELLFSDSSLPVIAASTGSPRYLGLVTTTSDAQRTTTTRSNGAGSSTVLTKATTATTWMVELEPGPPFVFVRP